MAHGRTAGEFVEDGFHFNEKLVGHLFRMAVADKDALDDEVLAVGRHRVSRDQPAALAQSIGEFIESEV